MQKMIKNLGLGLAISIFCSIMSVNVYAEIDVEQELEGTVVDELSAYEEIPVLTESYNLTKESVSESNIEIARQGVMALELSEQGLYYIEEACLNELKELENDPNCTLNEYSVLIPKARASTPYYWTTYSGRDYYTLLTSRSNITIEKNNLATGTKIAQWFNDLISLVMMFDGIPEITLLQSVASAALPSNYVVHTSDWMDSYISANPVNRAIYAVKNSTYVNLVNREYGFVRPYIIYHHNDATAANAITEIEYSRRSYKDVSASSATSLLYVAKNVYDTGANPVNYLLKNKVTLGWD